MSRTEVGDPVEPRDGGVCTLSIRDAAGHELIKQQITASQLSTLNYQLSTDLSSLPSGAYFITLSTSATPNSPATSSTQRLLIK